MGGPLAPALSKALALGDGGGRTTGPSPFARTGVIVAVAAVSLGDASPVVSPPSEASLGIWTFSLGLACMLLVRLGGGIVGTDDVEEVRWGCGG